MTAVVRPFAAANRALHPTPPRSEATPMTIARSPLPLPWRALASLAVAAATAQVSAAPIAPAGDQEIGVALRSQPIVDGRATQGLDLIPLADLAHGRWFARTTRGVAETGGLLVQRPSLRVGLIAAFEPGRRASGVDALAARGVPDRSAGLSYGPSMEWLGTAGPAPVSALARLRLHADADRGSQADARLTVGLAQTDRLRLGGFAQLTWADALSMNDAFGVDAALASRSGLPVYEAGGGLRQASAGLLGTWRLTPAWALAGTLEARALGSAPGGSPLVSRRGSVAAVLGVIYAF
jgi:outer membrane scaffolding protein for murein synthesis (MipA/OmpV family)